MLIQYTGKDYKDNDERFILLAKSVFELISKLGWIPDIIHCNDWQGGLIPVYLKSLFKDDEQFKDIKTVFTIHNLVNKGEFPKSTFEKTGLPEELNNEKGTLLNGKINFLKVWYPILLMQLQQLVKLMQMRSAKRKNLVVICTQF